MRRHLLRPQAWAVHHGGGDGVAEPVIDAVARQRPTAGGGGKATPLPSPPSSRNHARRTWAVSAQRGTARSLLPLPSNSTTRRFCPCLTAVGAPVVSWPGRPVQHHPCSLLPVLRPPASAIALGQGGGPAAPDTQRTTTAARSRPRPCQCLRGSPGTGPRAATLGRTPRLSSLPCPCCMPNRMPFQHKLPPPRPETPPA
jgi:hypothetical protein